MATPCGGKPIHTEDVALFSLPPINAAEDKISWSEYKPSFISQSGNSSIQFHIAGNSTQYIDLSRTELYCKIRIEKADGGEFNTTTGSKEYGLPVDQILHSMWTTCDVKLNHTLVSTSGTNYNYKAYLETLLNYNQGAKKVQLAAIGFSGEKGDFDQTNPEKDPFSYGLKARYGWFNGKTCVEFMGPLLADICNQDRLILNGVDVDISLFPSRDPFRLITHPDGIECKLAIEEIFLNVCKVAVSPEVMWGHNAALAITDAKYPFQRTDIRSFSIPVGSYGQSLQDIWQGEVPSRLVVGLVKSSAYAGDFKLNPYKFDSFNISGAGFYVNGEPTPRQPYRFNMEGCDYLQGLLSLYRVAGKLNENTDIGITRDTYRQGYNLIGFDVDPTTSADFRYLGKKKQGHTLLDLRFKKALAEPVTVILYATFPELMEIDLARNVKLEEKTKIPTAF